MNERSWIIAEFVGIMLWSAALAADISTWITGRAQIPRTINQALLIIGGTAIVTAVILWDRSAQRAEWISTGYRIRAAQEEEEDEAPPVRLAPVR